MFTLRHPKDIAQYLYHGLETGRGSVEAFSIR